MLRGATQEDRDTLRDVFGDFSRAITEVGYDLRIKGRSYRVVGDDLRVSSEEDGPALVLEATVRGKVPLTLEGESVELDYIVAGVEVPGFRGELRRPQGAEIGTKIVAASASSWLAEDATFGKLTAYSGRTPESALSDVLSRIGRHERVNLPAIGRPLFYRIGDDAYAPNAQLSEAVDAIEEESGLQLRDDVRGWARGFVAERMDDPGEPVVTWRVGREIVRDSWEPTLAEERRYYDVAVFRTLDNGGFEEMAGSRFRVRHRQGKTPPACMTLWIETTDTGPDAAANAIATGFEAARSMGEGSWGVGFSTVMLDPRIERCADTVEVVDVDEEAGIERRWHFRLLSHEHTPLSETRAAYTGVGLLASEEELAEVSLAEAYAG